MLYEFRNWFEANRQQFEERRVTAEYVDIEVRDQSAEHDGLLKTTAWAAFYADSFMVDIIVWRNGMRDVYVLDCETAEYVLIDHHEFAHAGEMFPVLEHLSAYLLDHFEVGQ